MQKMVEHQKVVVRVPATTANLGPGFDSLGMALSLWNHISMEVSEQVSVRINGQGDGELPTGEDNLMYVAASRLMAEANASNIKLEITAAQEVPIGRGLGSSACAIIGGMVAANALLGFPVDSPKILKLASEMEGHSDNVSAALLGGCCIAVGDGEKIQAAQIPVSEDLQCVVFIPETPMATKAARGILADRISRDDASFNISRTALLIAGLALHRHEYLAWGTEDRIHQDSRMHLFPAMKQLFANALKAGARGVFLSGAGSSVVALTTRGENRAMTIGLEMSDAADKLRVPGSFLILEPTPVGVEILTLGDDR